MVPAAQQTILTAWPHGPTKAASGLAPGRYTSPAGCSREVPRPARELHGMQNMSRPWMPLYVADYLADTGHLRTVEHGAYMLLIMHYWRTGGLPNDDAPLARIARMTEDEWRQARPAIAPLFQGGWKHKRIEHELTEAARISAAGRAGGKASGEARRAASRNGLQ